MPGSSITSPSETALAKLREWITDDAALAGDVKEAVLVDLEGDNPAALTRLKALLSRETGE